MSRIGDLIAEHCPEGVEFRKLRDVARIRNGSDYKQFGDGDVPVYGTGGVMTTIDTAVYDKPSVLIPRKGSLGKLYFVDQPFWTVDTIFYTEIHEAMEPRFFYYYLQTQRLAELNQAGGVPSLTQGVLNELRIPVPAPAVQREIVGILDEMTNLEAEIEAELEAELEHRSRQYAYYRDELLAGGEVESIRWATLGELYESSSGLSKSADQFGYGQPFLSFKTVFNNPIVPTDLSNLVNSTEAEQARYSINAGDVFVTRTSEDLEGLGMSCAALRDYPKATFNGFTKRLRPKEMGVIEAQFAAYFFRSSLFRTQIARMAVLSTRVSLNDHILMRVRIPVPPMEEQQRIVAILNSFEALVNDLSRELPAEIKARRQQYEYYRDKLLTFPEKAS